MSQATSDVELGDAALVQRALVGDHDAFAVLHQRHRAVVSSVVRGEIRRGPAASDADDVIQEVFTQAWQRLAALREAHLFRPWLIQIARRAVIDHARRSARRPVLDHDDDLALEHASTGDVGPDEVAELADLAGRLRHAIAGMNRRDATAVTLAAQFGFGPVEIGDALGITPNNAKVVLHRARARLRTAVADD